ncbi:hypothetical protein RhiirC2_791252 [Rhizophagus irregularis]|uniref:Uncharacterized protein n=1 Tax=Rhizophagus irregularis TaxID=588596 RepID=A0A2N1MJK6_9GLOM|nr:hypothetical protein RhiirC2_791252 [Rhizophagus irregularis]
MLAAVFSVVKEDINSEICFHYVDGKEIGCILADAYSEQALGILILIHLKHIYKNLNIRQKSEIPTEIKKIMYAIPHLKTKAEVLNVLEQIKLTQNKQAIGISKAFTLMPIKTWNFTRFDTNVSELVHANVNRDGISLSFLGAIYSYIIQTYNVPETYKNKSSLKRMENSEKRLQKRKSNTTKKTNRTIKKQKTTISNIDNSYDSQNVLEESNLPN